MAALLGRNKNPQQQCSTKQQKRHPLPVPPRPNKEKYPTAPMTLARDLAGLCFYHWSFGDKANNCTLHSPLLLAWKLVGWGVVGAIHPGKLVHVTDSSSGATFLIDTGLSYNILPHSSCLPPTGPLLKAASGQRIPC